MTNDAPGPVAAGPTGTTGTTGDAAGPSGVGVSGEAGMRKGGRVPGQRPDPRMLAAKLKTGAKVDAGTNRPQADDVETRLSRGEFVVNRAATRRNLPELERINASAGQSTGRGGMAVGQPRTERR